MKRKTIKSILALSLCAFSIGLMGCGQAKTDSSANGTKVEAGKNTSEFSKEISLLYNDDEELGEFVPVNLVGSSRAEAMMQVAGYTYTLDTSDKENYKLTVVMTCGTEGSDMYMKRTVEFTGAYKADGSVYTLEKATGLKYDQETAGQFAATSGEGGADYWGPNGLSFDETYTNPEKYAGVKTGASLIENMKSCKVTVDGSKITSFEAL